jgi:hypothetical protein
MSDALSFTEIVGQQVELLPARTVMSMFFVAGGGGDGPTGGSGPNLLDIGSLPTQTNSASDGLGGHGGGASAGRG